MKKIKQNLNYKCYVNIRINVFRIFEESTWNSHHFSHQGSSDTS